MVRIVKFSILSRGDQSSDQIRDQIKQDLLGNELLFDQERPDIVVSVGGDGTLLEAFHRYAHRLKETAFVGVHTGHLGFYADWRPNEIDQLVDFIANSSIQTVDYPLLEVKIEYKGEKEERFLALNECMVKTIVGSLVMDVEINQEHFETFRGDGLCISTPSGSTAYNKSLGGAIVHPALCTIQVTEMASINNRVFRTIGSPLILPDHHTCILKPMNDKDFQISIDHISIVKKQVKKITLNVAQERVRFARYQRFPFWTRVKESFVDGS